MKNDNNNTMRHISKKKVALFLIALLVMFVVFPPLGQWYFPSSASSYGLQYDRLTLRRFPRDLPVVIVDEHREVIPYWYKAAKEGLLQRKGNTLVHFDAHADMTLPSFSKELMLFHFKSFYSERDFLPLMEQSDTYIISAILEGIIERVIWVKPDWLADNKTLVTNGYIGTMLHRRKKVFCSCRRTVLGGGKRSPMECGFFDLDNNKNNNHSDRKSENDKRTNENDGVDFEDTHHKIFEQKRLPRNKYVKIMDKERCRKFKPYKFIEIPEYQFVDSIQIKRSVNLAVDIDEDFFGTESGVEHLINEVISLETQQKLHEFLPQLYAPKNYLDEKKLDQCIRTIFSKVIDSIFESNGNNESPEEKRKRIEVVITENSQKYFRKTNPNLFEISHFLMTLSIAELQSLSKTKFCLSSSLRFSQGVFSICHGSKFPNKYSGKMNVPTKEIIDKKSKLLKEILEHIAKHTEPKLVTVARSIRHGYTPRNLQKYIERVVLRSIDHAFVPTGRRRRLIFDPHVAFGKQGWYDENEGS